MREEVTDELIDEIAKDYLKVKFHVEERLGGKCIPFEQYLKEELDFRAWEMRKNGIKVEVTA